MPKGWTPLWGCFEFPANMAVCAFKAGWRLPGALPVSFKGLTDGVRCTQLTSCGRNSGPPNPPIHCRWEISHPGHNLAAPAGKGVVIPFSGEHPKPFSQMTFIGNGMCRCIQHTSINVKKAIVIQKQVLSIDNNWRNTKICHRSGSVSHTDARGSLRRISWDKEFILYALNLNIWFISPEPYKTKQSKLQRIQCIYQAWFPPEPLVLE